MVKALIPENKKELIRMLACLDSNSKILGGGTDLVIAMQKKKQPIHYLLYAGRIKEMQTIVQDKDFLRVGAYAVLSHLAAIRELGSVFSAVRDAASDVGSSQIRNLATIGGNIANASPASDLLPNLFLFQAQLRLLSPEGERMIPVETFITGAGKTKLNSQEIIACIEFPRQKWEGYQSAFVKLGYRTRVSVARMGLAIAAQKGSRGELLNPRLWIGAVAAKPLRLAEAEEYMHQRKVNESMILRVSDCLQKKLLEIPPRKSTEYKIRASRSIVEDALIVLNKRLNG